MKWWNLKVRLWGEGEALGDGHEGRTLTNKIPVHIKKIREYLVSSPPCEFTEEGHLGTR